MQKKKFLLIIIFGCLLLSGCSTQYDLIIRADNSVNESIKLYIPNTVLLSKKGDINKSLDYYINIYKGLDLYKNYNFTKGTGQKESFININKNYSNLQSFIVSPFISNTFENIDVVDHGKYVTFQTVGSYRYYYIFGTISEFDKLDAKSSIDSVLIRIKLENKVLDSNAYQKDEKNNVYTWKINPNDRNVSIYIKYSKEKRYDILLKSYISEHFAMVVMSIIIISAIILLTIFIGGKYFLGSKI